MNAPDPDRLEKLCIAGPVVLQAGGSSMGRRYPDDSDVRFRVRRLERRRPLPGTILVFQDSEGRIVAHRLIASATRYGAFRHYTKGDGNKRVDPSIVPERQFIAEAVAVVRNGKETDLTTLPRRLGGLLLATAALPRLTWQALRRSGDI